MISITFSTYLVHQMIFTQYVNKNPSKQLPSLVPSQIFPSHPSPLANLWLPYISCTSQAHAKHISSPVQEAFGIILDSAAGARWLKCRKPSCLYDDMTADGREAPCFKDVKPMMSNHLVLAGGRQVWRLGLTDLPLHFPWSPREV